MKDSDLQRIQHIKIYCEEIAESIERFGSDFNTFASDKDYFKSVSMSIMQIGELSVGLSDEFKSKTKDEMPWAVIKGMRNYFAHSYAEMKKTKIWATALEDIPGLLRFCQKTIEQDHTKDSQKPKRSKNDFSL